MEQGYDIECTRSKSEQMTHKELYTANEGHFKSLEESLGKEAAEKLFKAYMDGVEEAQKLSH